MGRIVSLVDRAVLPLPKLKKVAAYARVSSGKDEMIHSLSAQVSYYSQMIQNHPGWEYAGVYSDKAYTGTKSARPDFERLLQDCKAGKIDMVITKSISRFVRNTLDLINVIRELKSINVDVYFDGNYLKSETDVFGNTVEYAYNKKNGNLESITNAKGNVIKYKYDRVGRLVKTKHKSPEYKIKNSESKITYKNGVVSSISHNNDEKSHVVYNFDYDNFGKLQKTSVGAQTLSENIYDAHNGLLKKSTYGNGDKVQFDYDKYERLIGKTCTKSQGGSKEYTYSYNSNGLPFAINDKSRSETVSFEYDNGDRLTKKAYSTGIEIEYKYDEENIANEMLLKSDIISFKTTAEFKQQGCLTNSKANINGLEINRDLWYDKIGRLEGVSTSQTEPSQGGIKSQFTYVDVPDTNKTSTLVESVTYQKSTNGGSDTWEDLGINYSYEYDANYNITKVLENGEEKVSYEYNAQNQLIRENNALIDKTIKYEYDFGGNILSKKEYAYSTEDLGEVLNKVSYDYSDENWKDKLTGFNGEIFTYDEIGNPLTYRDGLTMTWTEGRKLERISKSGLDVSFEYGFDGIRRKKTVNGEVTEFITDGIMILAQKTGDRVLAFLTDGNGDTYGFVLNDVPHFYVKNVQGDVVGITDVAGNIEVRYTYDSWGKLISITDENGVDRITDTEFIGYINPIRYRGYYYDSETGIYYLNARYYDPQTGRFINADDNFSDLNLYRYCFNNFVNFIDYTGCYSRSVALVYMLNWHNRKNSSYRYYSGGDCANFVSQCLKAGGFEMNEEWHSYSTERHPLDPRRALALIPGHEHELYDWDISKAWRLAKNQYEYFKKSDLISEEIVISSAGEIIDAVKNKGVQCGDLMYLKWDKDYPHHATMISFVIHKKGQEMIYYAAHTDDKIKGSLKAFFDNHKNSKAYILKIK